MKTVLVLVLLGMAGRAQAPVTPLPVAGVPTINVQIAIGHSATITAPSDRVTTHPGFIPGTTVIEIDTQPRGK